MIIDYWFQYVEKIRELGNSRIRRLNNSSKPFKSKSLKSSREWIMKDDCIFDRNNCKLHFHVKFVFTSFWRDFFVSIVTKLFYTSAGALWKSICLVFSFASLSKKSVSMLLKQWGENNEERNFSSCNHQDEFLWMLHQALFLLFCETVLYLREIKSIKTKRTSLQIRKSTTNFVCHIPYYLV